MEIEKLPTEIAANIFSRLPFKSVLQCRCVSKSWCNLLQLLIYTSGERYFAKLHHSRIMDSSSSPDSILIMLDQSVDNNGTCEDDDGDQLHYVEYNEDQNGGFNLHYVEYNEDQNRGFNRKAMKKFNSPLKMDSKFWTMASSSNGLICSAHQTDPDDSYLLYIYNPFLGEYITLPNNFKYSAESSMAFGFGHIPSTDEYKVVRIVYPPGGGNEGNVEVYTLGGDKSSSNGKWKSKANVKGRLQCDSPGVLVNESLHWLAQKDEKTKKQIIIVFDLLEEKFFYIPLPSVVSLFGNGTFKIRELDGSLCVIDYVKEERIMLMWNFKEVDKEKGCWKNIFGMRYGGGHNRYEHCFYWKKVDQSLVWMSNSSVVTVEHHRVLGPKIDLTKLRQARLFHGIPHIKSFVSLTALGENDVKTIKDNNRKRKRDNKQRRKQKRRRLYIVCSSDDE